MQIIILICSSVVGYIIYQIQIENIGNAINSSKTVVKVTGIYAKKLEELKSRKLLTNKLAGVTPVLIVIFSILIYLIAVYVFSKIIGVLSTAIIMATPLLFLPYIVANILIDREKQKIMRQLPTYIINLKNYVEQDNNIIKAMKQTMCAEPLKYYIDEFNGIVVKGISTNIAFRKLKENVNIKIFSGFVVAIESCTINGGDFSKILEKYVETISKENLNREKTKEKAYSSIIILGVMVFINIYLIFSFVFSNPEYSSIVKDGLLGRIILNVNAISYIAIGYIVSKIYRIGE